MTLAAVSDAGLLIRLAEIDSLELFATFDALLVPETVYKEVEAGETRVGTEELDAGERATRRVHV